MNSKEKRERNRHIQPTFDIRKDMERSVVAFNSILKDVVKTMPLRILLFNCHPLYRMNYAEALKLQGYFTEDQWFSILYDLKKYQ